MFSLAGDRKGAGEGGKFAVRDRCGDQMKRRRSHKFRMKEPRQKGALLGLNLMSSEVREPWHEPSVKSVIERSAAKGQPESGSLLITLKRFDLAAQRPKGVRATC